VLYAMTPCDVSTTGKHSRNRNRNAQSQCSAAASRDLRRTPNLAATSFSVRNGDKLTERELSLCQVCDSFSSVV